MRKLRFAACVFMLACLVPALPVAQGQEGDTPFYFGVDLSYVNEMEDCGAVYRENGEARDPFALFSEHGATLVRARLWHNPDWTSYSTLTDVKRTFRHARDAGMSTLLDIHYSDNWADPSRQEIPAAWIDKDDAELADAVYQYTYDVLGELHAEDLTPAFVQVGNEINSGILKRGAVELDWQHDAPLLNAGIQAIRDFAAETGTNPQIVLHVAQPENTDKWFTQAEEAGVTDFDVIGISYYPQWSMFSIADLGVNVNYLRRRFGKEVMVVETAYGWTHDAVDETANNILTQAIRGYPFTPEGQSRFITAVTQSLISNGALGIVYWEPAWVSTKCFTRWGQGSHWENATFFDFHNNNEVLEAIDFPRQDYWYPDNPADGIIEADYGNPLITDESSDVLGGSAALDLKQLYVSANEDAISLALTIVGDMSTEQGNYLIYFDTTHDAQGANVDPGRRPITVADPFKPEFRLDINAGGSILLSAWDGTEWQQITYTGNSAILAAEPSVIEVQIPLVLLGQPDKLYIAVLSTDQSRVHTAADILGTAFVPSDWSAALVLDQFVEISCF